MTTQAILQSIPFPKLLLTFSFFVVSVPIIAQTEAKVNLATLPFLIPNFGLEVPLGEKQSFQLDVLGSFWDEQPLLDDTPFHVNQVF